MANRALSLALHVVGAAHSDLARRQRLAPRKTSRRRSRCRCRRAVRTLAAAFRAALLSIAANPKAAAFGIVVRAAVSAVQWHGAAAHFFVLAAIQLVIDTAWCAGVVLAASPGTEKC